MTIMDASHEDEPPPPFVVASLVDPEGTFADSHALQRFYDNNNTIDEEIPMQLQNKQGGKCCISCCDYRRAVIFTSGLETLFSVFWIVAYYADSKLMIGEGGLNEDVMILINKGNQAHAILNGLMIVSSACAFAGALRYNGPLVVFNIFGIALSFVIGLIIRIRTTENLNLYNPAYEYSTNWFVVIMTAMASILFVYPQVMFILEVNAGILSKRTYPREEYSCCCVSAK